jgi:hypothetical protein
MHAAELSQSVVKSIGQSVYFLETIYKRSYDQGLKCTNPSPPKRLRLH